MLGGLALKKRWQARVKASGRSIHEPGPNIVMGAEAQVALEKFARYFDVECRLVPITKEVSIGLVSDYGCRNLPTDAHGRATTSCRPRMR